MAAITSQTFQDRPLLSFPRVTDVFAAGARLIRAAWVAAPKGGSARSAADEAEAVRRMADGWMESDPAFAADLYAAAARHESTSSH